MLARATIVGLYNYDNTIFDDMVLPSELSKDNVVNAVLDKGSEFGCMYLNCDFLKGYIRAWSVRHYNMFQRWTDARLKVYDPIRDYYRHTERTETSEDNENRSNSEQEGVVDSRSGTDALSRSVDTSSEETSNRDVNESTTESESNAREKDTSGSTTRNETTENKVSAFDSSTYSPKDFGDVNGSDTVTGHEEESESKNGSKTITTSDDVETNGSISEEETTNRNKSESGQSNRNLSGTGSVAKEGTRDFEETINGLTGKYAVQELLEKEYEIAKFEVEEQIADLLVDDICIRVY